ncbi:hypothetical protein CEE69_17760 [Rhodopirellula bahusiensis]|uniref:Uncharacterized protein n=1 Tax=Rhodopirellula bahusiensis TaxID=2014065 RepID=A0A2G1W461_9BACT|nr:hypothetical protein CEE69_17760 [Rhodopirellula bahusiensis]
MRCNGCEVKLGRKSPDVVHLANFLFLIAGVFPPGYVAPSVNDSKLLFPFVLFLSFVATTLAGIWSGRPWPYEGFRFFPRSKIERYRVQHLSANG